MRDAAQIRLGLLAQHERLRAHLARCSELAYRQRAGEQIGGQLEAELEALHAEFVEHNVAETAVIRTLLHGPAAWGSLMIDRMIEEHIGEHVAFAELMTGADAVERIDELAEMLDAHMAAEERTFLSPVALRDDVIRARMREE